MRYAVNINSISPVFQDSSEKSMQITQMLFGEICTIKSQRNIFCYIINANDKSTGWTYKNSLVEITEIEYLRFNEKNTLPRISVPTAQIYNLTNTTMHHLLAGSVFSNYNKAKNNYLIGKKEYQAHPSFLTNLEHASLENIHAVALQFVNAPYMQGGKSVFGIDAAGFIQLVYSICGYLLPRFAVDQLKTGVSVYSIDQLRLGDLIFISASSEEYRSYIYLNEEKVIGMDSTIKILAIEDINLEECNNYQIRRVV